MLKKLKNSLNRGVEAVSRFVENFKPVTHSRSAVTEILSDLRAEPPRCETILPPNPIDDNVVYLDDFKKSLCSNDSLEKK